MGTYVLLVDDDVVQAEARSAILSHVGIVVIPARSANDALTKLEDTTVCKSIGLMVTDHIMPGMNGPELVHRVLRILPNLPILVLSGLPTAESEYKQGQVSFRLKPFPPTELIRLAKHMLEAQELRSA